MVLVVVLVAVAVRQRCVTAEFFAASPRRAPSQASALFGDPIQPSYIVPRLGRFITMIFASPRCPSQAFLEMPLDPSYIALPSAGSAASLP
jgi:hypothetical protein